MMMETGMAQCESPQATLRRTTLRERIEARREQCAEEMKNLDEALALLNESPTFEKIQNAVAKLSIGLY